MKKFDRVTQYTIIICIGLIIFNIVFGYVLSAVAIKAMRTQINERMLDISNTAAAMLSGDDLIRITSDDYGSVEYERVMKTLTYFQDNIELEYIYCIIQVSEKEFVFGVDPTIEDPGEFGSPIVYTDALYSASKGTASVDQVPYTDDWGVFYSSYSPVFASNGDVAGIVAVDFSAEWYQNKIRQLYFIIVTFISFGLVCSIFLAISIASQYEKFFSTLIRKMNDLSNGIQTLINEVDPMGEADGDFSSNEAYAGMRDAVKVLEEKIIIMQMRLTKQIEIIRSHAYIDALTGINNRNSYMEYLDILEDRLKKNPDMVFSVVVFDINQLKMINDDYGHDMGDKLIIAISNEIRNVFGGNRIYRVGGDEFVTILDEPDPSAKIAELKDRIALRSKEKPICKDFGLEIAVSAGYAAYDPDTDRNYSDVLHRADNAMYTDKRAFYQTHEDRRR
jgi:diguanylate cyclase (GGDEF)-like protein